MTTLDLSNWSALGWFLGWMMNAAAYLSVFGCAVISAWLLFLLIKKRSGRDALGYGLVKAIYLIGLVATDVGVNNSFISMCGFRGASGYSMAMIAISRVLSSYLLHLVVAFAFTIALMLRYRSRPGFSGMGLVALLSATAAVFLHVLERLAIEIPLY